MLNLYLWKNSSDTQSGGVGTWISKINADYYGDGADHVQTITVDAREVSYISVMEAAVSNDDLMYEDSTETATEQEEQIIEVSEPDGDGSGDGSSEKDITGKMNGVMYAVCPINDKVFYVVQVTEYDVEDMPELENYIRLLQMNIK